MRLEEFSRYLRKKDIKLEEDGERAVCNNGKWSIGDGDWVNMTIIAGSKHELIEQLEEFGDFYIPSSVKEYLEVFSTMESISNIANDICEKDDKIFVSYYDDNSMFVIDFFWEI